VHGDGAQTNDFGVFVLDDQGGWSLIPIASSFGCAALSLTASLLPR
jgi:hypothetical protein